jgi:uncharacterized protein (DUF2236 family)
MVFMKKHFPPLSKEAAADNKVRLAKFNDLLEGIPHKGMEGYFGPNSASWALYREPWVLIGGIRALMLQIAHPAIADGVHRYSNFQEDALDRGRRTFMAMAKIYFAEAEVARKTAVQLHHIHSFIRGTYVLKSGAKKDYCANDPDLLLWVLATLIDTTFLVFDLLHNGMETSLKHQFYEETKVTAQLMGIPEEKFPPTLEDFNAYFKKVVDEELTVDLTCRQLAQAILDNRYSSKRIATALAVGLLPSTLSAALDLEDGPRVHRRFHRLIRRVKWTYKLIPPYLRYAPAWHQAHFRLAKDEGQRTKLLGHFYQWLSKKMHIPLGI